MRLRGTERIGFDRCHWSNSGGAGLWLDLHAQSNRVVDSVFEHLGGAGIVLAGYGCACPTFRTQHMRFAPGSARSGGFPAAGIHRIPARVSQGGWKAAPPGRQIC
ncbi:MAG: hypothetical protein EXS37_10980 [Opitutus sp.]|nr:hypothetical protein [Opitutus sp.]